MNLLGENGGKERKREREKNWRERHALKNESSIDLKIERDK